MSEYIISVLTVSFFYALINSSLGEKGSHKSAMAVMKIIVLAVVIAPIVKSVAGFSITEDIPVINRQDEHMIDNEEEKTAWRGWLAKVTASELSAEISSSVKKGTGLEVTVECPWHFEGDDVVFEPVIVYCDCNEKGRKNIENYVKLHYSLDVKVEKVKK